MHVSNETITDQCKDMTYNSCTDGNDEDVQCCESDLSWRGEPEALVHE